MADNKFKLFLVGKGGGGSSNTDWWGTQEEYDALEEKKADVIYHIEGTDSSLKRVIVEELPTENIDTNTIYMVLKTQSEEGNIYDEWMYINNQWELIGSTKTDLSDYYTKEETNDLLDKKADTDSLATVATSGSYNDLNDKPTISTVNNAKVTIIQGTETKGSFTLNQSTDTSITLEKPKTEWYGTKAEYDAIETKDVNTVYYITDAVSYNDLKDLPTFKTVNGISMLGEGNINGLTEYSLNSTEDMATVYKLVVNGDLNFRVYDDIDCSSSYAGTVRSYAIAVGKTVLTDVGSVIPFVFCTIQNARLQINITYVLENGSIASTGEYPLAMYADIPTKTDTMEFTLEDGTTKTITVYTA